MDSKTLCNLLWLQLTVLRDFCGHVFIICDHRIISTSTLINVKKGTSTNTELSKLPRYYIILAVYFISFIYVTVWYTPMIPVLR